MSSFPRGKSRGKSAAATTESGYEPGRVNAARNRIARVHARLHLVDRTPDEPDFPTELRLLREALDLLDPDVKLV